MPIVLRVPRGMAVLATAGVLGLIVLSYWVGHARGVSQVETRLAAEGGEAVRLREAPPVAGGLLSGAVRGRLADDVNGGGRGHVGGDPQRAGGNSGGHSGGDPRQPGLNYMILARYRWNDARALVEFLATQGVETIAVSADNDRFAHVIAVGRGFEASQLASEARHEYQRRLQAAGRAWKRHNNGLGDALESMYMSKYDGG